MKERSLAIVMFVLTIEEISEAITRNRKRLVPKHRALMVLIGKIKSVDM